MGSDSPSSKKFNNEHINYNNNTSSGNEKFYNNFSSGNAPLNNNFIQETQLNQPSYQTTDTNQFNEDDINEFQNNGDYNNNNGQEINYDVKYSDQQLISKLSSFTQSMKIQESIFKANSGGQDPIFDAINVNLKEVLIEVFKKYQHNFVNGLLNYLNSSYLNIEQNLVSNLIQVENGYQVYTDKVMKEIAKIDKDKDLFKIEYLTILVIGKTGVGKSTLINEVLNLKPPNNAKENNKDIETMMITPYKNNYLRLVDTRGLELENYPAEKLVQDCINYKDEQLKTNNFNNAIHCIWYCINGARLEPVENKAIRQLRAIYGANEIPIIMVYTQSTDLDLIEARKEDVSNKKITNDFVSILARRIKLPNKTYLEAFGLDELLQKTLAECKKALSGDLHAIMTKYITNHINENLKKENLKIRNYIKESNILDFTKKYNLNEEGKFTNYTINVYGKNVNCFLNKKLSDNGKNIIAHSNLIRHNSNFIHYYKEQKKQIISQEIETLSIKGLVIQANLEKKNRQNTLIQNKRDLTDFNKQNTQFLSENFSNLAQKYYIFSILQKSSLELSGYFENELNNLVKKILNDSEIKNSITYLFKKRFKDFDEKISRGPKFNQSENAQESNNFNNSNNLINSNSKSNGSNGIITKDFTNAKNSELSSINSNKYSNFNNNKQFSDVATVMTIPLKTQPNQPEYYNNALNNVNQSKNYFNYNNNKHHHNKMNNYNYNMRNNNPNNVNNNKNNYMSNKSLAYLNQNNMKRNNSYVNTIYNNHFQ